MEGISKDPPVLGDLVKETLVFSWKQREPLDRTVQEAADAFPL